MNWHKIRSKLITKLNAKHRHHMTTFGSKIVQEDLHKTHKIYKLKGTLAHIISINFKHVKYHKKVKRKYQERMVVFLDFFVKKLNAHVVQTARTGVHKARQSRN